MALPLFNIGGLASGLDTNSIIDQLMAVERIPIQQLESRKAEYQEKDSAWQDVNTRLSALRTSSRAIDSVADFAKFATVTSSDESAVAVTVTGSPAAGSMSFTVSQLAANHQTVSDTTFTGADDLVGAGDFTVTIDGTDHVVTATASTTLGQLADAINDLDAGITASVLTVDAGSAKLYLSSDTTGDSGVFSTAATISGLDNFDVSQQGIDAELTLGSGPGAVTVYRDSNTISDLYAGVQIDLKATTGSPVSIAVARDVEAMAEAIKGFVDELNATLTKLNDLTAYNADSDTAGPLAGDSTARGIVSQLRAALSATISERSSTYAVTSSIGIHLNRTGTFEFDESTLRAAIEDDYDAVVALMSETGYAADTRATYVSGGATDGTYPIVVTQAASSAAVTGSKYKKPSADVTFQITSGGVTADITVIKNDTIADSVDNINAGLLAAGITTVTASEGLNGAGQEAIVLGHSGVGTASEFDVFGDPFGLAGTFTGTDVAGTIGGQAATGSGYLLTSTAGDPLGIVLRITAAQSEIDGAGGSLSLGDVEFSSGVLGALGRALDAAEGADGSVSRARERWQSQIELIDDRIEVFEDRLVRKEARLLREFSALEVAMAGLTAQASFLASLPAVSSGLQG